MMEAKLKQFSQYLTKNNLKSTAQRIDVLKCFLSSEKHLSAEDLYRIIKSKNPKIGYTTVYRTMKLICEAGFASEVDFSDGFKRIERNLKNRHHDHLICLKCGKLFEVFDSAIELLQDKLAKKNNFTPIKHKMDIFGYCHRCK